MNETPLTYVQFGSFRALERDAATLESLISLYRTVFGDPAGWGETYSREDVLRKLGSEVAGHASLRVAAADGKVVAFCWAQTLDINDVAQSIKAIKYYQSAGMPEITSRLGSMMGNHAYIYVHELAIDTTFRGRVPLTQLIYPVLRDISERAHVRDVLFWSIADTLMSRFARRALFEHRLTIQGMEFHVGQFSHQRRPSGDTLRWNAPTRLRLGAHSRARHASATLGEIARDSERP